jgi:serine/threonine-protein kinase
MNFLSNLRADRLISQIKSSNNMLDGATQKSIARLKELGTTVIEPVLDALPDADKTATIAFSDVLGSVVDAKSLPIYLEAMNQGSNRTVGAIVAALSTSRNFPSQLLLDALAVEGANSSALLDVISAHRSRIGVRELLKSASHLAAAEKSALFRIVGEIATTENVPDLIARLQGKDQSTRIHIVNILGRFSLPEAAHALHGLLADPNKLVRTSALTSLAKMTGPFDVPLLCKTLLDPEIEVQNRAVDVLIKANDKQTIKYLLPVLKHEDENARRAAVEVLNAVGDIHSVKFLLAAIKDDDWWVRSRAGDALGKIGGPKVIDAVLELVRDKDDNIRRAAIEILNQTKDERAIDKLIEATKDADWWVSERAIDALAEIGSNKALPRLLDMVKANVAAQLPVVIRAIGKLGDVKCYDTISKLLTRPEKDIRIEAVQAVARLVDEQRADSLRIQLQTAGASSDTAVAKAASRAVAELDGRFHTGILTATMSGMRPDRKSESQSARMLTIPEDQVAQVVHQAAVAKDPKLDITTLKPGDMIEGRYKYVQRIGKGAFGTVLLMEDTVVDERLILKFLNANVAEDEEVMKRFVHELRYSRKITHRNVIRIYDFLFMQGLYAISMEYFPSHTLGGEIVNEKPVELKRALGFGIDICTGMAVAHQVGIVHRDLKPANVLINDEGLLKIVDFGVAAAHSQADTQLTKTGYVIGSPKYMAPEQILGRKVDERADVYAVGVIMYEMLTGIPPYSRGDHMSVMYQHVQGKAKPAAEVNPQLPAGLGDVIMRAMAVDKAKRYASMDELRVALEGFMPKSGG